MEFKLEQPSANHTFITGSARTLAIILLLINGISAFYGSLSLMTDPTGTKLGLPPDWIFRLPFRDYLIPGMILFIANGVFSFVAAIATLFRNRAYEKFVMAQGCILTGWILIQVLILQTTVFLHFAMGGIGVTLFALGIILSINRASHRTE